jgi:hypothetical protein
MHRVLPLFLALFSFGASANAQHFDLGRDRLPIADLNGPWRFHMGDDPRWADPGFDDSGWKLLKPNQPWSASGEKDAGGFAWYRLTVRIPADVREPSLFLPQFAWSLQVFADGKLIGNVGMPPPHQRLESVPYLVCRLPGRNSGSNGQRDVVIAIRAWNWWKGFGFGPGSTVQIGARQYIDQSARLTTLETFWNQSWEGDLILVYLIGSGGLFLFFLRRSEREYLWFGAYELASAADYGIFFLVFFYPISYPADQFAGIVGYSIKDWIWILFLQALLKNRRHWAFLLARIGIVWAAIADSLGPAAALFHAGQISFHYVGWCHLFLAIGNLLFGIGILYALYKASRARVADAFYLLIAFALYRGAVLLSSSARALAELGWTWPIAHIIRFYNLTNWPFPIGMWPLTELLTQLAMLGILGLRFARSRRDEERFSAELEAASVVQHVLIPEEIPQIPGFAIEATYKPAGQIGGDFFQILPLKGGGVLVVIGDVSGKGMPAAMTVSLLVGTLRTLAHYTESPSEILAAMNQRMLARSNGGFTTCLVLRCDAEGKLTIANAGHIAPYVAGKELPLENGLPLGIAADTTYAECFFQLAPGEQLTLLTDGVVEARDKAGALLSFERSAALSVQPAKAIACAAQAFGQDDDITVLTLSFAGVPASA